MKKLLTLLLIACITQLAIAQTATGDTLTVILSKDITVKWNVRSSSIIQDKDFLTLKANRAKYKEVMYDLINDLTPLNIKACFKTENLRNGDVAFTLFNTLWPIPYLKALGKQFDVIYPPCIPPDGLYDYLEANRTKVANDLRTYYETKK